MEGDSLQHYGIEGQKWGERNGPPYPLRTNTRSNTTKQTVSKTKTKRQTNNVKSDTTKRTDIKNRNIQDYIKEGKIRVSNLSDYNVGSLTRFTNNGKEYVSGLTNGHDFDWQEVTNDSRYGLQSVAEIAKQNYTNIGSYGKYQFSKNDAIYERSINHGRVDDYSMKKCNPTFGSAGTMQNCAKCSATLELASRGLNFTSGRQTYPSSVDSMSYWFKGAERMHMDTDITEDSIKSFGNKTSGTISIQYPDKIGGGHAMHWTVDDEGNFEIQDGQNNRRFPSLSSMMDTYGADPNKGLDVFRLDNCEPDWDHLSQESVVRDPDGENAAYNRVRNKFSGKVVDTW